jgi:Leucine-rich repeat (LRR) protein
LDLPDSLTFLNCSENPLKELNLPKGLETLFLSKTPIEHLDIAHTQLEYLSVSDTKLWSLSEFPATLKRVQLYNNALYALPNSFYTKKYVELDIHGNRWTDETLAKLRKYARQFHEKDLFFNILSKQKKSAKVHEYLNAYKKSKTRVCVVKPAAMHDLVPDITSFLGGSRKTKKKKTRVRRTRRFF